MIFIHAIFPIFRRDMYKSWVQVNEIYVISGYKTIRNEWYEYRRNVKRLTEKNETEALEQLLKNYTSSHPESTVKVQLEQIHLHPNFRQIMMHWKRTTGTEDIMGSLHDLALIR